MMSANTYGGILFNILNRFSGTVKLRFLLSILNILLAY